MRNWWSRQSFGIAALTLAVGLVFAAGARADWVNLGGAEVAPNIAEIHIERDGVRVVLEVFVGDLKVFADLVPSEWMAEGGASVAPDPERLARFARMGLVITPEGEDPLPVQRVVADRRLRVDRASPLAGQIDPYTGRTRPSPPDDPRVLYTELFYPFAHGAPEALTIAPPMADDAGAAATIGAIVFHEAVPVIDFRFLSSPARIDLDWSDPWYSKFDNPNLTRHHRYPRMAFVYAEPYEIRQEALVRVRDVVELLGGVSDTGDEALDPAQAAVLIEQAAEEIGRRTTLTIDGQPVSPDFDRGAFMRIGMRGLEILQPGEPVNVDAGVLGLIWSAPTDGLPQEARLVWDWFDDAGTEVSGYAIDAAGPFLFPLRPEDREIVWTNHFKISPYPEVAAVAVGLPDDRPFTLYLLGGAIALGLGQALLVAVRRREGGGRRILIGLAVAAIGAAAVPMVQARHAARLPDLDPAQLTALTGDLLNNVYRAFDFRLEDQVYDRLALTLEGETLQQVYLDQRESLRIERAGGADARVDALQVTAVEPLPGAEAGTLRLRADWMVRGSVGHWGHVHQRSNVYEADLTLVPVDGDWKIRTFDVLSQERLL